MTKQILFLCTGNYYRSRFAEAVFNKLAREQNIDAMAISRGLKINMEGLTGTCSPHAIQAAKSRGAVLDPRALQEPKNVRRVEAHFLSYGDFRASPAPLI